MCTPPPTTHINLNKKLTFIYSQNVYKFVITTYMFLNKIHKSLNNKNINKKPLKLFKELILFKVVFLVYLRKKTYVKYDLEMKYLKKFSSHRF